ncbi:MFS transporter [Pseudomonas sp. NPDC087697]|uniref:MFS transporter n=1 Tax=Pseudomonas sp. NPDC087697 TaxID=3364447 RepID=UPI003820943E
MKTSAHTESGSHQLIVLTIVLVSYLMIVLDISIVITALPKIQASLQFTHTGLSWVQNAYTLAFGGLLLLGARAGDILGRRRMLVGGLMLFTAASLAIGFAQSPAWLIIARAAQGVGAAILAPSTLALLSTNFAEGPARTRAFAYYGATAGVGASIGLVLGGVIADWLSWRVGFFINLPIGIALMLGARRYLAETVRRPGQLDVVGALCSTLGMSSLVYGIVRSASDGWGDSTTLVTFTAGVLLLAVFVLNEGKAEQPIMPLRLFANRERAGAYAARVLFLGAMVGFWFFTTQYLQGVLGYGPFEAGVAFLPTTLVNFAAAMAVPRLTHRFGNGPVLAAGLTLSLLGLAWLSRVSADTAYLTGVALPMMLIGIGQGCTLSPLTVAGVAGVAPEDAGAASGLVNVAHQLGGSLGLAILIVVFDAAGSSVTDAKALFAQRVAAAFSAGTLMLALALVVVLALIVRPQKQLVSSEPA